MKGSSLVRYKRILTITGLFILGAAGFFGVHHFLNSKDNVQTSSTFASVAKAPDTVVGKKVVLKKLQEGFFIDFHNMFSQDVRHSLEFPEYINLDYTMRFLKIEMKKNKEGKQLMYCIFDAKEDKLIGALEVREKNDKDPGQFGCWLNEGYRGGGRIQEATKLIATTFFSVTDEPFFTAHVRLWNKRSYKALLKAGFRDTGKFYYEDGKPARYLLEYVRPQKSGN